MKPAVLAFFTLTMVYISFTAWLATISPILGLSLVLIGAGLLNEVDLNDPQLEDIGFMLKESPRAGLMIGLIVVTFFVLFYTNLPNQT